MINVLYMINVMNVSLQDCIKETICISKGHMQMYKAMPLPTYLLSFHQLA